MNVLEQFREIIDKKVNQTFLIDSIHSRRFTYGECQNIARNLVHSMAGIGVNYGDRVVLLLNNCAEMIFLYLGCLYAGVVVVPINPSLHKREVDAILIRSNVKMVIYSQSTSDALDIEGLVRRNIKLMRIVPEGERLEEDNEDGLIWLSDSFSSSEPDKQSSQYLSQNNVFSINFTSGTTSIPKGVIHKVSGLMENSIVFNREIGINSSNRFIHVFPMYYMAGFLNTILSPMMAGSSIVISRQFDARSVLDFWDPVMKYDANTLWLAPTMVSALLRGNRSELAEEYCRNNEMTIFVGTAPLPYSTKDRFEKKYGVQLLESYGLSETLIATTNSHKSVIKDQSVGRPLDNVGLKIVDESNNEVDIRQNGEVLVSSPNSMAGYLEQDITCIEEKIGDTWFRTGDFGYVDEDGYLFITGRKKDLIIRGGINISPRAVEDTILEHKGVEQVAVIGLPHEFYGEEVIAVLVFSSGYTLRSEQKRILEICSDRLNKNSIPTKFVELEKLPVTVTGKIQKAELRVQISKDISGSSEDRP